MIRHCTRNDSDLAEAAVDVSTPASTRTANGTFEATDVDGSLALTPTAAANLATKDPEAAVVSAVNYQNHVLEF